jgi:hypothetical protein
MLVEQFNVSLGSLHSMVRSLKHTQVQLLLHHVFDLLGRNPHFFLYLRVHAPLYSPFHMKTSLLSRRLLQQFVPEAIDAAINLITLSLLICSFGLRLLRC